MVLLSLKVQRRLKVLRMWCIHAHVCAYVCAHVSICVCAPVRVCVLIIVLLWRSEESHVSFIRNYTPRSAFVVWILCLCYTGSSTGTWCWGINLNGLESKP